MGFVPPTVSMTPHPDTTRGRVIRLCGFAVCFSSESRFAGEAQPFSGRQHVALYRLARVIPDGAKRRSGMTSESWRESASWFPERHLGALGQRDAEDVE